MTRAQEFFQDDTTKRFSHFYDLQKFKVKEILVISSLYDEYVVEEDGSYSEMILAEYNELNISTPPPRLTRASTVNSAIEIFKQKKFDLVITMSRLHGMNPFEMGRKLKKIDPDIPVILLLTSYADMQMLPPPAQRDGVDEIFLFSGDSNIFLAIIKHIEDKKNIDNDVKIGKVRVIVVIEDSIDYYSLFMSLLYKEIVRQTKLNLEHGVNHAHRLLLVRGRPKLVLAKTFEEAKSICEKYEDNILALISDISYPIKPGEPKDPNAGYKFVEYIRSKNPYLPVMLQSSDENNKSKAEKLNVDFIHKHSPRLLNSIINFLRNIGFGDFIFKLPNGQKVGKAKDFTEFAAVIQKVPIESIIYHGTHNHFSNWLFCRSEFELGEKLRKLTTDDFESVEEIRHFLKEFFEETRKSQRRGIIEEFSNNNSIRGVRFMKVGGGSLGGKGRGLAFIISLSEIKKLDKFYSNVDISVPETIIITTEYFNKFIEDNNLLDVVLKPDISNEELINIFLSKSLPKKLRTIINSIASQIRYPIAVRSSSLLEDSQFQPFAGIYKTYMLPNTHKKVKQRAEDIRTAIKLVYASTFSQEAKSYIETIGQKIEVEKMAVIIQRIAGKKINNRFYPTFSGVARSYNYYPIDPIKTEDGVAYLALGHGAIITEGKKVLSYSPRYPKILPAFSNPQQALESSQTEFYALDLENTEYDLRKGEGATLTSYPLEVAREDKELKWIGAVYDPVNEYIRDGVMKSGPLLITFPFILKYNKFPLNDIILKILEIGQSSFGCEVEIEFAVTLDYETEHHKFDILQIRPLVIETIPFDEDISIYEDVAILSSDQVLGNGIYENITDIVYVKPDAFNRTDTYTIEREIADINSEYEGSGYILIGPGRWGTSDRFLGIPVKWNEINKSAAIVEMDLETFQVDPSSGQHFFLNITSSKKPYFTIPYNDIRHRSFINWDWIYKQEKVKEGKYVVLAHLKQSLMILINGKKGEGVVIEAEKFKKS